MLEKSMIDVSVVIPFFNSEKTISRTLLSICHQSLLPREVIIIDDCSANPERLNHIVSQFSKQLNIKCIFQTKNNGAAYARNIGVDLASSSYIAFLDSDDVWHPKKLEVQYLFMLESGAYISGHEYVQDLNKSNMQPNTKVRAQKVDKKNFIIGNPFFTPTIMIKSDMYLFNPNYRIVDDYCCWLENLKKGSAFLINSQLAGGFKAAIGASGLTGNMQVMHEGYKLVLRDLYEKNEIGTLFYFLAILVETLKYPLRKLKCNLTK
ncbi:glycosyltransferase family 2 protein [Aeromonas veronii]|nr:glycosyltransferase family 2 protein [Aeromonas veronii]